MIYDLDKLIEGKFFIEENIKNLQAALDDERGKLAEYERHIKAAKAVLKQHGEAGRKAIKESENEASRQDEG